MYIFCGGVGQDMRDSLEDLSVEVDISIFIRAGKEDTGASKSLLTWLSDNHSHR